MISAQSSRLVRWVAVSQVLKEDLADQSEGWIPKKSRTYRGLLSEINLEPTIDGARTTVFRARLHIRLNAFEATLTDNNHVYSISIIWMQNWKRKFLKKHSIRKHKN
ncbi:unnamed protein product [Albugo candida]|uniref:Uncharacterized protein n=1 Tax=Albugo candida TaxID=65357 RepID=A0A024FUW6_9STRA|nr:unnamed protein product [Albugo candida]|eukprot:CCI10915.1 unnamed protein product [Albugo candida]